MRRLLFTAILAGLVGVICGQFDLQAGPVAQKPTEDPKPPADERFDKLVREDLFAGFGGDEVAMARGMAKCDAALARDPKHAEALVWRGAVRVFRSGQSFGKKDFVAGMSLWQKGVQDMDDAVALAPEAPGVRIPRAAVLMPAARNAPAAMGQPLLVRVVDDFQTIARLQANHLDKIGTHPLGELRMGLADVYRLMGNLPQSNEQLELIKKQLPDTEYAARATTWLAAKPTAKLVHNCIGCHGQ